MSLPANDVTLAAVPDATPRRRPAALRLAVTGATGVVACNAAILAIQPTDQGLVALLVALAAWCTALLAVRRAPALAWLAAIAASYEASTVVFARARQLQPDLVGIEGWLAAAVAAASCALATAWIAGAYAARPARRLVPLAAFAAAVIVGWVALACLTALILVVLGQRTADPAFNWIDVVTAPTAFYLPFVLLLVALGIVADVGAARGRAVGRLTGTSGSGPIPGRWDMAVATARELVPGQAATEEAALTAERTRLAGDLHAAVLPALRAAIADAEAGGDPVDLARRLRAVDLELERLMADRWPVVLEALGLVAALEDLAERLEADGAPPVTIEVDADGTRPPAPVERAAWRFAQVALDNAVRHAGARSIDVSVALDAARLRLVVADDGAGFDRASAVRPGARGLVDATRIAAETGAAVRISRRAEGGTSAEFGWPRSG